MGRTSGERAFPLTRKESGPFPSQERATVIFENEKKMATKKRASAKKNSPAVSPLTPEQTRAWVQTYGRHSRIYAWGFFALILPLIFGLIWWEMGEVNDDVLYSFGFAATVTFLLARWSRKQTTQSWVGVVEELFLKQVRVRRDGNQSDDIAYSPRAKIRTQGGKALTLRLTEPLYEYFAPGDRVFKISGLDWPEKVELDRAERVCLACGDLYGQGAGQCPRCSAPEPDHAELVRLAGF